MNGEDICVWTIQMDAADVLARARLKDPQKDALGWASDCICLYYLLKADRMEILADCKQDIVLHLLCKG